MKITDNQRDMLAVIAREIGAECIVAYGSRAREEERSDSDLDIAILTQNEPDHKMFTLAFGKISDVFRGMNVDVRFLSGADPLFSMQVVRDGVLVYGDTDRYDDFCMLTNRRYIDDGAKYFPFFDEYLKEQQLRLQRSVL